MQRLTKDSKCPSMKDHDFSYQYITAIVIIKEIQIDLAAISQFVVSVQL